MIAQWRKRPRRGKKRAVPVADGRLLFPNVARYLPRSVASQFRASGRYAIFRLYVGPARRGRSGGVSSMSKHYAISVALVSSVLALLLQGAAPAKQLGEIFGDDVYVNCEYRVAAQFPNEPKFRDITYRDGARTAPARQFYFDCDTRPL